MIQHEQTDNGGSVTVKSLEGLAFVSYSYSNPDSTLSLWCSASDASTPKLVNAVVESLAERFSPTVLCVSAKHTETRYTPKVHSLFKCWGNPHQSVYAEAFNSRDMFSRICSLSYAMHNTDIVKVIGEEMEFYEYRAVMNDLRKKTTPFEFLSIKEECDHNIKSTSAACVQALIRSATSALDCLSERQQQPFREALSALAVRQSGERGFDTKYSYIREATTAVLLPAVVRFGNAHPFTQTIFSEFSSAASQYTGACTDFISEYAEILDANSSNSD